MADDYTATLPRKRVGAGVLFSDGHGRTLLVEPAYKDYWEIPGGAVEAGESPRAAAAREIEEELALHLRPGRLLVTDWVPPRPDRTGSLRMSGPTVAAHTAPAITDGAGQSAQACWTEDRRRGPQPVASGAGDAASRRSPVCGSRTSRPSARSPSAAMSATGGTGSSSRRSRCDAAAGSRAAPSARAT